MEDKQFEILSEKVDLVIRLLAIGVLRDKGEMKKVQILSECGFKPKDIAVALGKKPKTVRSIKSKLTKQRKSDKRQ